MKYKQLFIAIFLVLLIGIVVAYIETPNIIEIDDSIEKEASSEYKSDGVLYSMDKIYSNDFIVTLTSDQKSEIGSLSGYKNIQIIKRDKDGTITNDFGVSGFSLVNQTISNTNEILKLKIQNEQLKSALCEIKPELEMCK